MPASNKAVKIFLVLLDLAEIPGEATALTEISSQFKRSLTALTEPVITAILKSVSCPLFAVVLMSCGSYQNLPTAFTSAPLLIKYSAIELLLLMAENKGLIELEGLISAPESINSFAILK
ncbi:Protein of unknown function [Cotesia congregata]|uniref:Uncharacterized protein n=1 Tax=Cotesia congregata TaxID=51543 RepID=A0A8J2HE08_COTCN|nr:Protein of unknown function [Cotesia congregata]